ncbi:MAG: hypothetical protein FWD78_09500 [Treponema sp.]|nr:hypothetical protein [Treponema sp.]
MSQFDSMEQRIINMYIDLFPPFKPGKNESISESSQKQFYEFINTLLHILYNNPLLLFSKINQDDYFIKRFNKHSENKQLSYTRMKKCIKSLQDFFEFLYNIGKIGKQNNGALVFDDKIKFPARYLEILEQCGMEYTKNDSHLILLSKKYPELVNCWKWLSTSPGHSLTHFISCMFDLNYAYASDIYSKLSGNQEAFNLLESFLINNGYTRIDNRDNKVNLDYVKEYDSKMNEIKEPFGERTHGGISAQYDSLMENPAVYSLRIPYYKILLEHFEMMSDELKHFIVSTGKKCNGCRYCVQMDKTGEKQFTYITVSHKKEYKMCFYFPAFQYCWEKLELSAAENIIRLLSFAEDAKVFYEK